MTAIAQKQEASRQSVLPLLALAIGLAMLIGYFALPWVTQPELGPTTTRTLLADRDNNIIDVPLQGLVLLPPAGAAVLLFAVWSFLSPQHTRTTAFLTLIAGIMSLVYYVNFFRELPQVEADLMSAVLPGFWLALAAGIAMVIYGAVMIPRSKVPGYELSQTLGNQESVLGLSVVFLLVVIGIANPRFLAERNMSDVLQGNAYIAVAAIGMSMVIISGNIDISVGSLIGVLATISGTVAVEGFPIWLSWVAPVFFGIVIEGFIGFLVAYLRIPSIIVTLGMLSILKGGLISVTSGEWITDLPEGYHLSQMRPLGIPVPIVAMVVLTVIAALWMRYSATGRAIYAVGGNREAARLSGISERGILMRVFLLNGFFVGVAALLFATQLSVIQSTVPTALELVIITASVVGGVSILGGTGTVIGSTIAALLLNTIRSSMVFINVSPFWLQAVQGVLILVTVLVDLIRRRRQQLMLTISG